MTNFSIRAVVFLGVCTVAVYAYGISYSYFTLYSIGGNITDVPFGAENGAGGITPITQTHGESGEGLSGDVGSGHIVATAGPGILGVYADEGIAIGPRKFGDPGLSGYVNTQAMATFTDGVTITDPDLPLNSTFHLHAFFDLSGSVFAQAFGEFSLDNPNSQIDSYAIANLQITGTGLQNPTGDYFADAEDRFSNTVGHEITIQSNAPVYIPVDETVFNGVPTVETYQMTAQANGSVSDGDLANGKIGFSMANSAFEHTLSWGGITSVTDANGNPITGWSITSASGFDYTQPAPEPSTGVLVAIGGIAVAIAARRRASS
jgi:hypothetical protein